MTEYISSFHSRCVSQSRSSIKAFLLLYSLASSRYAGIGATGSTASCKEHGVCVASPEEGNLKKPRGLDVNSLIQGRLRVERMSQEELEQEEAGLQSVMTSNVSAAHNTAESVTSAAGCAVCFVGELRHLLSVRGNLQARFLKPIAADGVDVDVFVAGPKGAPYDVDDFGLGPVDDGSSSDGLSLLHLLPKVEGVTLRAFRFNPELSLEELGDVLKKRLGASVLELYKNRSLPGSNLLETVLDDRRTGRALQNYHHEAECKELILAQEAHRGSQYEWWIRTRPDFDWLAPHPPLSLLDDTRVWVFDTDERRGVDSRHVVGRRDLVKKTALSKYDVILNGDPLLFSMKAPFNDGNFSRIILEQQKVAVGHIPLVAHVIGCPKWANNCWRTGQGELHAEEEAAATINAALFTMLSCWSKASEDRLRIASPGQCQQSLLHVLGIRTWFTPKRLLGFGLLLVLMGIAFTVCVAFGAVRLFFLGGLYFFWSTGILLTNKYAMNAGRFPYPVTLVMFHMLSCTILSTVLKLIMPSKFPSHKQMEGEQGTTVKLSILTIAACFAFSLCLENAALTYSSVAFLQMVKEPNLIVLASMSYAVGLDNLSRFRVFLLFVTVLGTILMINGEVHLSLMGLCLQVMSSFCNCIRLVLQGQLLGKMAGIKLCPFSYLALVAPACLVSLVPAAGLECYFSNAAVLSALKLWWAPVLVSCILACGINLIIAAVVQEVSALGFSLLGSSKSACIIVVFFLLADLPTTAKQVLGVVIVFASVGSYSVAKCREV